jgi:hypothetical protein
VYVDAVDVDFDVQESLESDDSVDEHDNTNEANRAKDITTRQRQHIYEALLQRSVRGKLKRKSTTVVAELFQVNQRSVRRVRNRAKKCQAQGQPVDVSSMKAKNCGRKKNQFDFTRVATIPLLRRNTIRKLASELCVPKSSLHRWFKDGQLRHHSNALKPFLKAANMKERLR